ncbi:MAG: NAD-dependent epimerase/dehydratase family protein [Candidatus Omnitrophica bacterium]|nr:NAD-dependent epimerase/dehydratase family protein [Candidatus Omnitrophota bacterium]
MKILILGGDGYLGWPQALHFSTQGHDVFIVDSLMRRDFDAQNNFDSLIPLQPLEQRVGAWKEKTGRKINFAIGDTRDYPLLSKVMWDFQPEAIVHFAEQRTAPYSMIDREHAVFTMDNNVIGTLNVLYAIKDSCPESHLVKLGTMGEYGTPNIDIEEGFIEVTHKGRKDRLPYPKAPSSFYHLSKVHDSHNIMFACKVWGLRATDLNQGVVYGIETRQTSMDPRLATRFDYDQIYGTVLNRFCAEAVIGYPLTVYGRGGQTRGYINIQDTMSCVDLAVTHPAPCGEYRVFNQFTETFSVGQLALIAKACGEKLGLNVRIEHLDNPRVESEGHYYRAANTSLLKLGLQPHLLEDTVLVSIMKKAMEFSGRIDKNLLAPSVNWRRTRNSLSA